MPPADDAADASSRSIMACLHYAVVEVVWKADAFDRCTGRYFLWWFELVYS